MGTEVFPVINTILKIGAAVMGLLACIVIVLRGWEYHHERNIGERRAVRTHIVNALSTLLLAIFLFLFLSVVGPITTLLF